MCTYALGTPNSSTSWGLRSIQLVQINSAYVPDAKFAFVHRSHSGRYGMVNSEEGYQNLHRFLFGDLEVTADLVNIHLPGEPADEVVWQAETKLSLRGLPIVMHEQLAAHHCPIQLERPRGDDTADRPVPLVTTFLSSRAFRPEATDTMRYMLQLRIISIRERNGVFWFGDHIEQSADFDDVLVVDVQSVAGGEIPRAWAEWASNIRAPLRTYELAGEPLTDTDPDAGEWQATVNLPSPMGDFLGPEASVRMTVRSRRPATTPRTEGRSRGRSS